MSKKTIKTSVSLDPEVLEAAREKVGASGQSVSSYINVLIRQDLLSAVGRPASKHAAKKGG